MNFRSFNGCLRLAAGLLKGRIQKTRFKLRETQAAMIALAAAAALAVGSNAAAAVVTYEGPAGLAAFNAAAGNPGIGISFEGLSADISGQTINGVRFVSQFGNTYDVVSAACTFTTGGFDGVINASANTLTATSGRNILSPGGSALTPGPDSRQVDDLELIFSNDIPAFGLDILLQSFDLKPGVRIIVFNSSARTIASYLLTGNGLPGGAPGGSVFFGVTSDAADIRGILIADLDNDKVFPDANLGYDTFRFGPSAPSAAAPEPASWALMILGFGMIGAVRRRRWTAAAYHPSLSSTRRRSRRRSFGSLQLAEPGSVGRASPQFDQAQPIKALDDR